MKKLALIIALVAFAGSGFPQAIIFLDNINNTSADPAATANGLFWLSTGGAPVLIHQDFSAAFYGGTDSTSLTLIRSFTGTAIVGDNSFSPGTFADLMGNPYGVPGTTTASASAFFQVQAWIGDFSSYAAAVAGGTAAAQSPVFPNPVCAPPCSGFDFIAMPAMVLGVPEPATFSLIGAGLLALLWGVSNSTSLRKPLSKLRPR